VDIHYEDLAANYREVIRYAVNASEKFSVITTVKKPYSGTPAHWEHEEVMKTFEPYVLEFAAGIRKWPGTETKAKHKAIVIYRSCKAVGRALCGMPNFFLPMENGLPEDITFYRNGKPWLITVSHENLAWISDCTAEDRAFFRENGIRFDDEGFPAGK